MKVRTAKVKHPEHGEMIVNADQVDRLVAEGCSVMNQKAAAPKPAAAKFAEGDRVKWPEGDKSVAGAFVSQKTPSQSLVLKDKTQNPRLVPTDALQAEKAEG